MSGTVGSLFSGIGGFDLGLERAGWRVVWQVEKDAQCRSVLRRHWPDVELYEDVRDVGRTNLASVDLICGGFPCQDISVAGRRAGLAGERSGLFHEFMRIVGECAPRWVLIENVAGLLSSNDRRDMGTVLGRLGQLGYWWTWRIVDSQYFGVAQRRERVFIVGHLGAACPPEILLEPESVSGDSPPRRAAREGIAPILEAGARTASGGNGRNGCGIGDAGDPMFSLQAGHQHAVAFGGNRTSGPLEVAASLQAHGGPHGRQDFGSETFLVAFNATQDPRDAQGVIGAIPRRLTPRECERLQAFPDDWTRWAADGREIKDGPRYRMLGNAVTVSVAAWIGVRIAQAAA